MPQDASVPMETSGQSKDRPVYRNQSGMVEMAIWANVVKMDDGSERTMHNITFKRNYRDKKDDEWKKSDQYGARDLGDVMALTLTAQQFLMKDTAA